MTREEAKNIIENRGIKGYCEPNRLEDAFDTAIKALEQEPSRDMEEIKEVINCDADAETKCKMISNILNAKLHYFEEPFINKPCVSTNVCKHDKEVALNKIKTEIKHKTELFINEFGEESLAIYEDDVIEIIDKYAK